MTNRTKVAIVTGSAQGIGAGVAARLAQTCHTVIGFDVPGAFKNDDVKKACEANGAAFIPVGVDISDEAAVRKAFEVIQTTKRLDIVVNCAGIAPQATWPTEGSSLAEWKRVIDVNLTGTYLVCRESIAHLKASGFGRIITTSSQTARLATPYVGAHYVASKAGILGFTRTLAQELAPYQITVNCVAPGLTKTPMTAMFDFGEYSKMVPLGRVGEPEDVAGAVAYLTSEEARYVTGITLDVNGGTFMPS